MFQLSAGVAVKDYGFGAYLQHVGYRSEAGGKVHELGVGFAFERGVGETRYPDKVEFLARPSILYVYVFHDER